ncbi:MAG TPA: cytochrome c3 family protein [Nitrospirota bacterium]|nr:cytochrome c3 family protein [Nitrospirota bacterium]
MNHHVLRPLYAVIGIVVVILIVRAFFVPKDFGVGERGYMYGWHRQGNEEEWKKFKIKYRGSEYCKDCHSPNYSGIKQSLHKNIQCENCHGPAADHPDAISRLPKDGKRAFCLRCHAHLSYPSSGRRRIRGFENPEKHNPGMECVTCHNPHSPKIS